MFKRIHVNRNKIAANKKNGTNDPVVTVKYYTSKGVRSHRRNEYAHEVAIFGPSKIVYDTKNPLNCGAVLWIETDASLGLIVNG